METSPETEIRSRIAKRGKIPFAEFVELALYHPGAGYYAAGRARAEADYFTGPAAHPAFGALIAVQLKRMWELLSRPRRFFAVEIGAGAGRLARDAVDYARANDPEFGGALRYVAVDLHPPQGRAVGSSGAVSTVLARGVPLRGIVGCMLSNELLDAFPFHRFQIVGGRVAELYVTVHDGRLVSVLDEPSNSALEEAVRGLGPLPEGFIGEVRLQIAAWMEEMACALDRGFALTIDYGYEAGGPRPPSMDRGTVQTFYRHTSSGSPYQRIGMQDITARVNFTQLAASGESAGLTTLGLISQAEFLETMGIERLLDDLRRRTLSQRERDANRAAMLELLKPEGLGGFKVLIQERRTGVEELSRLAPEGPSVGDDSAPLLGPEHTALLEGRYPHLAMDFEELWPRGDETGSTEDAG